ncbi:MAG: ATP-binding protein [Anaerolineaceae bacterium]|nr:ATP-binding protein [Anaerolineaceae bacterium]
MSLRLRLTIFYSFILGGVLLVFSGMVYGLVGVALMDQIDQTLIKSGNQLIDQLYVNTYGQINSRTIMEFNTSDNLIFQVWGQDRELQFSRPISFTASLDEGGKVSREPVLNTVQLNNGHYRVISVPITSTRGMVGMVQVAENLLIVDVVKQTLAILLIVFSIFSVFLAGVAAWIFTGQVLEPIMVMTHVATQIVNADDLQRRIPISRLPDDEVGKLIFAFNNTLSRLEAEFNSQRRFMADISHDLRTPLTVIKGNVGLMRRMNVLDEESMASIETEVDRLVRLVSDLLLHFQMESGNLAMQLSLISLDELLLNVINQIHIMGEQRVKLSIEEIEPVEILGDADRLKRVFINLLDNSVKYTPTDGKVRIRLRKRTNEVEIEIEDTGPGIPQSDLQHVFHRFYRGEKSRKRSKDTGFGLGLSIAYYIVQAHNGDITVQNKHHETGAIFTVRLPIPD